MNTIWSYIDGTLSPKEREAFERELAASETLRSEVESARMLMSQLAAEPLAQTSNHFTHNVLVELSQITAYQKPKRKILIYLIPSAAALAAIIIALIILVPSYGTLGKTFSVRQFFGPLIDFLSADVSSLIVTLISCGYVLFLLDNMLRRRLLRK